MWGAIVRMIRYYTSILYHTFVSSFEILHFVAIFVLRGMGGVAKEKARPSQFFVSCINKIK